MTDYVLSGQSWNRSPVSWYFTGASGYLPEIARAFARWDTVINLDFVQAATASQADIALSFGIIDGAFNTLAIAHNVWSGSFYTGDTTIQFDSAESWTWSPTAASYVLSSGVTFFAVALHEIGHAIGLNHPTNSSTVMYATASAAVKDLTAWDIAGAQLIYGAESAVQLPDLDIYYVPTVSAPLVAQGGSITFSYFVTNWGGNSTASSSGIYLSTDSTITTSDRLVATDAVAAITGGGFGSPQRTVTIPTSGIAPGTYYLGVIADYNNTITEADETNNASAGIAVTLQGTSGLINALSAGTQLETIYVGYFNRAADGAGFNFWSNQNTAAQRAGQSAEQALTNIANAFQPQPETLALYPALGLTSLNFGSASTLFQLSEFIDDVYLNLFTRAPDAGGKAYWTGQITSGAVGFGAAILAIANGAIGSDATIILNKVDVALDFTVDTSAANLGLTSTLSPAFKSAAQGVVAGVTATAASVTTAKAQTDAFIASQTMGAVQASVDVSGADWTIAVPQVQLAGVDLHSAVLFGV